MTKTKVAKYLFGVLFFCVSLYSLRNYIDFKSTVSESRPIVYSLVETRVNKGGRGKSYDMIIKYRNLVKTISITSTEFHLIENGKYPELFYSRNSDLIFSRWTIKLNFRITILFLLLSVIAVFPWNILKSPPAETKNKFDG